MQIISGKSRGIALDVPTTMEVRPTSGRARKALFDSLGDFTGARVADLFAGSGALGLESVSRGADALLMVENNPAHLPVIERNMLKVRKTGVAADMKLLRGDALAVNLYQNELPRPDVIFADPPYAESESFFTRLVGQETFARWASGALLVWELPDRPGAQGSFIDRAEFTVWRFRKFGAATFFLGEIE